MENLRGRLSSFELYSQGRLEACLLQSAGATATPERILRVRALIRKNDYVAALDTLAGIEAAEAEEEALLLALKSSCHSYRGELDLARAALAAVGPWEYCLDVKFELAYAQVLIAWTESDPDTMDRALHAIDVSAAPTLYGRWLYARSWLASLRGDYPEQLRVLQCAAEHISSVPEGHDLFLLAKTTRAMSHLVREIYAKEAFAFTVRMAETLPWNEELEAERFLTLRSLAWAFALRGMHERALQYAYMARDIAPSRMWITSSYCDQAYLARMARENQSSDALLAHAVACAKETSWTSQGEERVSLLDLAEVAADRDPAVAHEILAIYDSISAPLAPKLALAHDSRLAALEAYSRGVVLGCCGDRTGAVDQLASAYATFCSVGYAWRAAAAALRIHMITDEDAWLRYASEAVAEFTESSVAEQIRKRAAAAVVDPRVAALTRAQRRVFALMCEGLGDKEIALRLGISRETVKNHAVRVRAAFGVRSRAALIASTRDLVAAV